MLEGLQTEIDKYPTLIGASNEIKMRTINTAPAETEAWVVRDDDHKVPKGDMLALMSAASQVKLYDWMEANSDAAKGFKLFYYSHDQFKTTDPVFRGTIQILRAYFNLITEAEETAVLRMGERLKTRAEEVFGRLIELGDFE